MTIDESGTGNDASVLEHALAWVKGELIEAVALAVGGILLLACVGLLWRFGATPAPRSLVFPVSALAVFFVSVGGAMAVSNHRRLSTFNEAFENDPAGFVEHEIERVRGFSGWYGYTFGAATLSSWLGWQSLGSRDRQRSGRPP